MRILIQKTKSITTSKKSLRCKFEIDDRVVEQVMEFNYLGVKITSSGNLVKGIKTQAQKAARVAGCLNHLVWRNKHMRKETKSKIYKETVRPIMPYSLETRKETSVTRQMLQAKEISTKKISWQNKNR